MWRSQINRKSNVSLDADRFSSEICNLMMGVTSMTIRTDNTVNAPCT